MPQVNAGWRPVTIRPYSTRPVERAEAAIQIQTDVKIGPTVQREATVRFAERDLNYATRGRYASALRALSLEGAENVLRDLVTVTHPGGRVNDIYSRIEKLNSTKVYGRIRDFYKLGANDALFPTDLAAARTPKDVEEKFGVTHVKQIDDAYIELCIIVEDSIEWVNNSPQHIKKADFPIQRATDSAKLVLKLLERPGNAHVSTKVPQHAEGLIALAEHVQLRLKDTKKTAFSLTGRVTRASYDYFAEEHVWHTDGLSVPGKPLVNGEMGGVWKRTRKQLKEDLNDALRRALSKFFNEYGNGHAMMPHGQVAVEVKWKRVRNAK